jgi:hypothetical protein
MGLFEDLLAKASELTGMGQDAAGAASQAVEDVQTQAEDHIANATEQLPQDPADVAGRIFGDNEK